jgi:hypothetical protein
MVVSSQGCQSSKGWQPLAEMQIKQWGANQLHKINQPIKQEVTLTGLPTFRRLATLGRDADNAVGSQPTS